LEARSPLAVLQILDRCRYLCQVWNLLLALDFELGRSWRLWSPLLLSIKSLVLRPEDVGGFVCVLYGISSWHNSVVACLSSPWHCVRKTLALLFEMFCSGSVIINERIRAWADWLLRCLWFVDSVLRILWRCGRVLGYWKFVQWATSTVILFPHFCKLYRGS
jgi:hypothetical protein